MHLDQKRSHRLAGRAAQRLTALALSASLALTAWPAWPQQVGGGGGLALPALGDAAAEGLPVGTERRLGDQIMREVRQDPAYADEPVLLAYVQALWRPLLVAARRSAELGMDIDQAFAWEVFLVGDRSVNAFALPGGYVGVHYGLISVTQSRDELASVLAHEMAHVTQRHIARRLTGDARNNLLGMAAMILGLIAASRSNNPDAAAAAISTGQAAMIQGQLNFSREMEREADRVGYGMFVAAGFAPAGMAAMFERLDVSSRLNDNNAFPYLRSHPLTVERLGEARDRAALATPVPVRSGSLHALMQARARVFGDGDVQSLRRELSLPRDTLPLRERVGALYAGALAALALREPALAQERLDRAQQLLGGGPYFEPEAQAVLLLAQAQRALAQGQPDEVLAHLNALAALNAPDSLALRQLQARPALLLRAQAALARQEASPQRVAALNESAQSLRLWLADQPLDAAAWELKSQTARAQGSRLGELRAAAEARYALGDWTGAADRLRAAQAHARAAGAATDHIESSVVDARLRQITAQRRELLAQQRGTARGGARPPPEERDESRNEERPAGERPASAPSPAPASAPIAAAPQ
jgi:predicted Zn-dependent protease